MSRVKVFGLQTCYFILFDCNAEYSAQTTFRQKGWRKPMNPLFLSRHILIQFFILPTWRSDDGIQHLSLLMVQRSTLTLFLGTYYSLPNIGGMLFCFPKLIWHFYVFILTNPTKAVKYIVAVNLTLHAINVNLI